MLDTGRYVPVSQASQQPAARLLIFDCLGIVNRNSRFLNPQSYLAFDFDGHSCILDLDNFPMDTTDSDHFLTFLKGFTEFLLIFRSLHLGTDEEKIKNNNDQQ